MKRIRAFVRCAEIWAGWRCAECDARGITLGGRLCSRCYADMMELRILSGLKIVEGFARAGFPVVVAAVEVIERARAAAEREGAPQ